MNQTWKIVIDALPTRPKNGRVFWQNGDEILSKDEKAINAMADFLDAMGADACTGYYDPVEDERNGETNELTGYYYVSI